MKAEKRTKVVEELVEVEKLVGIGLYLSNDEANMLLTFLHGESDGFANARIAISDSQYETDIYDLQEVLADAGATIDRTLRDQF